MLALSWKQPRALLLAGTVCKEGDDSVLQKMQSFLKKDKKGQAIMELGLGLILVSGLMFAIFDFSLIIRTKTETMMMARNGVRYLVMQGVDVESSSNNKYLGNQAAKVLKAVYNRNHQYDASNRFVRLPQDGIEVKNIEGRNPEPIRDGNTGRNPVYVKVCEEVRPISTSMFNKPVRICSEYAGFHSSQWHPEK